MNKITLLSIAILSSFFITSCDDEVDLPPVLEIFDGYYIQGDATPYAGLDNNGLMIDGNAEGQATKYLNLKSGSITVTREKNSTKENPNSTTFGLNGDGEFVEGGNAIACTQTPGYYFFRSDVEAKSIDYVAINSWGVIGSATPGGWGEDTDMALVSSDNGVYVYSVDVELKGGEWLKFRANDQWAPQFGVKDGKFALRLYDSEDDPGSIKVEESGLYTVKMTLGAAFKYELIKK